MDVFSKEKRSEIMSKIRSKNTIAERLVFKELRKRKIYFQKHYKKAAGKPDIALPRKKKAVFIDGDFWHGYKFLRQKERLPKKYWVQKIEGNVARDKRNTAKLKKEGWLILRVWEHQIEKDFDRTMKNIIFFLEANGGKCAKKHVVAIIEKNGKRYIGSNWCHNPQKKCPRFPGEDYSKCKTICKQDSHAEIDAIKNAEGDTKKAVMYLIGHDHCCEPCLVAMKKSGIKKVVFNKYPNGFSD
jgi:DNA mismatch endonuclease (patch repair protein)